MFVLVCYKFVSCFFVLICLVLVCYNFFCFGLFFVSCFSLLFVLQFDTVVFEIQKCIFMKSFMEGLLLSVEEHITKFMNEHDLQLTLLHC